MGKNSDGSYTITGFPECPGCGTQTLKLRSMPGYHQTHWYCPTCGDWSTGDLCDALEELEESNSEEE